MRIMSILERSNLCALRAQIKRINGLRFERDNCRKNGCSENHTTDVCIFPSEIPIANYSELGTSMADLDTRAR
jgi:hypothetical protein